MITIKDEYVVYKKPRKIYCSLFRGHHDSIFKRLVKKHAKKERYKISKINGLNKHPGTDGISLHVQCWLTHANIQYNISLARQSSLPLHFVMM